MSTDQNSEIILRKQLLQLLHLRKLSASELSRRAGVPKQTISDWLGGVPPRNVRALRSVARTLGTSIEFLVFGEGVFPKAATEPAERPSMPNLCSQDLASLDGEWVMIAEKGRLTYLSARLAASLGVDQKAYRGRPLYEFIHVDDIPSDRSWQRQGPNCFRLASRFGETPMNLHQSMALGGADLTIHHFQPLASHTATPEEGHNLFDLRNLLKKIEAVSQLPPYPGLSFLSNDWEKQPLHICAKRSLLGRLLLITIHELHGEARETNEPIGLEVEADDRFYAISLQVSKDRSLELLTQNKTWRRVTSLARSCGVGLRKSDKGIQIHGPRIFLSAPTAN